MNSDKEFSGLKIVLTLTVFLAGTVVLAQQPAKASSEDDADALFGKR
jgi:hypothetical protein